jgi:hypothetical protein
MKDLFHSWLRRFQSFAVLSWGWWYGRECHKGRNSCRVTHLMENRNQREWQIGSQDKTQPPGTHSQKPASSSEAPPLKVSRTSQNSATTCQSSLPRMSPLGVTSCPSHNGVLTNLFLLCFVLSPKVMACSEKSEYSSSIFSRRNKFCFACCVFSSNSKESVWIL